MKGSLGLCSGALCLCHPLRQRFHRACTIRPAAHLCIAYRQHQLVEEGQQSNLPASAATNLFHGELTPAHSMMEEQYRQAAPVRLDVNRQLEDIL